MRVYAEQVAYGCDIDRVEFTDEDGEKVVAFDATCRTCEEATAVCVSRDVAVGEALRHQRTDHPEATR